MTRSSQWKRPRVRDKQDACGRERGRKHIGRASSNGGEHSCMFSSKALSLLIILEHANKPQAQISHIRGDVAGLTANSTLGHVRMSAWPSHLSRQPAAVAHRPPPRLRSSRSAPTIAPHVDADLALLQQRVEQLSAGNSYVVNYSYQQMVLGSHIVTYDVR